MGERKPESEAEAERERQADGRRERESCCRLCAGQMVAGERGKIERLGRAPYVVCAVKIEGSTSERDYLIRSQQRTEPEASPCAIILRFHWNNREDNSADRSALE